MDELSAFLSAEAFRARALDQIEIPSDIVELLAEFGFETVEDVLDADPVTLPPEVVEALQIAFGSEEVSWGTTDDAMHVDHDAAIESAVAAVLEAYRAFHPAESWPEQRWRLLRNGAQLELHLAEGPTVRGSLSAPLLLAARFRAASLGNELFEEFHEFLSFPREPLLEEQVGPELLDAARVFEAEGEHEEAVFCARRAMRDVRWIRGEEFAETDIGVALGEVDQTLYEDVVRVAECTRKVSQSDASYGELAEVLSDCAQSPDPVERYEAAVILRAIFEEFSSARLAEIAEDYFAPLHRLVADESDAVTERALHAVYTAGHKLWLGRHYRQALGWLELALDGGVYPSETLREIAECRLYVDGEVPAVVQRQLELLASVDESAFRGPWYDEHWLEAAHVRVGESLARKGSFHAARDCMIAAIDLIDVEEPRTLNLLGRAWLVIGDVARSEDDVDAARDAWERARNAFDAAKQTTHAKEVAARLSSHPV